MRILIYVVAAWFGTEQRSRSAVAKLVYGKFCIEDKNGRQYTKEQKRKCVLSYGVQWLLQQRNSEWGWGERMEAECIIALHLADDHWFDKSNASTYISVKQMNLDLLGALSLDNNLTSKAWSRGKLAQYICAIVATCQDPRQFYGHNLIEKLQRHLDTSTAYFQSNKFALSWSILALCVSGEVVKAAYKDILAKSTGTNNNGIDNAALIYLALRCDDDRRYDVVRNAAVNSIISSINQNSSLGNEFTTGLAIQALLADETHNTSKFVKLATENLVSSLSEAPWQSVLMATQVLPALGQKSYANINSLHCSSVSPSSLATHSTVADGSLTVTITVDSAIVLPRNQTWTVSITPGHSLFQTLQRLQEKADDFSFASESSAFGRVITTLAGIFADSGKQMYWAVLRAPDNPLSKGVDDTYPVNGDHFIFRLSMY